MSRNDAMVLVVFADPNSFYSGNAVKLRDPNRYQIANFIDHARLVEAAGFDAIFKPDFLGFDVPKKEIRPRAGFEPLTLISALSQHTRRVGLIVTESTSFTEPYNVARYLTSLDNLSGGRAGWNVVTSFYGEGNFGDGRLRTLAERYRRADEYMRVVYQLWEGWRDGAVSWSDAGHRFDGNFIDHPHFAGDYFRVAEALDIPPGPQRKPVIVQAGASEQGLSFAAKHAEIVFTAAPDIASGVEFYQDLKRRVIEAGRSTSALKILPGLNLFVGSSRSEAQAQYEAQFTDKALLAYRDKVIREAPLFKLGDLSLDDVIPASAVPLVDQLMQEQRRRSRGLLLHRYLEKPGITLRSFLTSVFEFGHLTVIGTPDVIAAALERWFREHASDGFVLKGGNDFARVANEVLPILKDRHLLNTQSNDTPQTFRQRLFGA